jgi:hypothetical protein
MSTRLADLRSAIASLDEAKTVFTDLAQAELALAKADAAFEHRIGRLKADHAARTEPDRRRREEKAAALCAFIEANKPLFARPRKVRTDLGAFGLQEVSDLVVTDEPALLKALADRRYEDCFKLLVRPLKPAIKARLEAGETLPGCHVRSGDTAVYKVDKTLLDEALASVVD